MKVGTIEEEATLCRAAFKDSKIGDLAWCVHHSRLYEPLTEPAESRIQYILTNKPEEERARRLHEMRPVKGELPAGLNAARTGWIAARDKWNAARTGGIAASDKWIAASDKWAAACDKWNAACDKYKPVLEALHAAECPDSTWNGTSIF